MNSCPITCRSRFARRAPAMLTTAAVLLLGHGLALAQGDARPDDRQVRQAVQRGLAFLYSQPRDGGAWQSPYANRYPGGVEALVALVSLEAGESPDTDRLAEVLRFLDRAEPETVYARALRVMAFARLSQPARREKLTEDVEWLARNQRPSGGWGYGPSHPTTSLRPEWTDNSNTFFAVMALDAARLAGQDIPPRVWDRAMEYWQAAQNADGGWGYDTSLPAPLRLRPDSYGSMTAGGVASVLAVWDALAALPDRQQKIAPLGDSLRRGLERLERRHSFEQVPDWAHGGGDQWLHFYLAAVARAANAAGLPTLQGADFHAELSRRILAGQASDGGWPADRTVRTCFALLALLRATRPVAINRLALTDPKGADARTTAGFAEWFTRQFDPAVRWQLVTAGDPGSRTHLFDAPLLVIREPAGTQVPNWLAAPLKDFLQRGGVVLVQSLEGAGGGAPEIVSFFKGLLPGLDQKELKPDHPVFTARLSVPAQARPPGAVLGDGLRSRVFVLDARADLPWQPSRNEQTPAAFGLAANLIFYALDGAAPSGPLPSVEPSGPAGEVLRRIPVARVQHRGGWDVCPRAMGRLSETLAAALSVGVNELPPVALAGPVAAGPAVLWITGTDPPQFTPEQMEHLKRFARGGGTVFIDSAVGSGPLIEDARRALSEAFGAGSIRPVAADSPLIAGAFAGGMGSDLRDVRYTRTVAEGQPDLKQPVLEGIEIDGRLAVILSPYGVTCPIEGIPTFGCRGLSTPDARGLAANVLLYAVAGP